MKIPENVPEKCPNYSGCRWFTASNVLGCRTADWLEFCSNPEYLRAQLAACRENAQIGADVKKLLEEVGTDLSIVHWTTDDYRVVINSEVEHEKMGATIAFALEAACEALGEA